MRSKDIVRLADDFRPLVVSFIQPPIAKQQLQMQQRRALENPHNEILDSTGVSFVYYALIRVRIGKIEQTAVPTWNKYICLERSLPLLVDADERERRIFCKA